MSKIAPIAAMIFSVIVTAFFGGTLTAHFGVFPYPNIRDAGRTLRSLIRTQKFSQQEYLWGRYLEQVAFPASDAPSGRWEIVDTLAPRFPMIANGGLNQYLELCPDQGCLAVAFDAEGRAGGGVLPNE